MKEKFPENIKRFEKLYETDDVENLFKNYLDKIGLLIPLKEYGVKNEDIKKMVEEYKILSEKFPDFGLNKIEIEDVEKIYKEAYDLIYIS